MKKGSMTKRGFSLLEMVIVIAIICILAGAVVMNAKWIFNLLDQFTV